MLSISRLHSFRSLSSSGLWELSRSGKTRKRRSDILLYDCSNIHSMRSFSLTRHATIGTASHEAWGGKRDVVAADAVFPATEPRVAIMKTLHAHVPSTGTRSIVLSIRDRHRRQLCRHDFPKFLERPAKCCSTAEDQDTLFLTPAPLTWWLVVGRLNNASKSDRLQDPCPHPKWYPRKEAQLHRCRR